MKMLELEAANERLVIRGGELHRAVESLRAQVARLEWLNEQAFVAKQVAIRDRNELHLIATELHEQLQAALPGRSFSTRDGKLVTDTLYLYD